MSVVVYLAGALEPVELDQIFEDTVLSIGQIKQGNGSIVIGRDIEGRRIALNVDRIISLHDTEDDEEGMAE